MEPRRPVRAFPRVDTKYNFPALEERIQKFWEDNEIFEKSITKPAPRGSFVFFEGPPTANNLPHIGHILTRSVKDLFPRYRTMRGYRVARKAGWDTHGLPVEIAIERKLGFEGKDAIETYGVAEFNKQCLESVRTYEREWAKTSKRIGFWLNYEDAYFTFTNRYIESVWWLLGTMFKDGLLYQGHKVLPYCPHCGTTHSSHEVAQNYHEVKDPSVYVKFRVRPGTVIEGQNGDRITADGSLYLLSWTTTPWTLPSNVALGVHPKNTHKVVESKANPGERYIVAEGLELPLEETLEGDDGKPVLWDMRKSEALLTIRGTDLDGLNYEPLYDFASKIEKRGWHVVTAEYVTLTDGTGIVHLAPAYGQDDYLVGQKRGLPLVAMVNGKGVFEDVAEPFKGMWFKDADLHIITDLEHRGLLLKSQKVSHSYPFCWRHDTPLFYFATESWFIRTTARKEALVANNQTINWLPSHIRDGRFGKWLENIVDWAISRRRYWGTPLPVWRCGSCDNIEVISSYQELFEAAGRKPPSDPYDQQQFNPHRPTIDQFKWCCPKCKSDDMTRVEEVIDCWFDAGAMPFAQHHYPFEAKDEIDDRGAFPADFISEAVDQTRGWFYTLHVIATLVKKSVAYKNCIVLGHILDEDGRKMSKRLGNVVDPWTSINTFGADTIRWYFFSSLPVGQPARYSERLVRESAKAFLLPIWNSYSFFTIYANIDGWIPGKKPVAFKRRDPLDRWVLSRLNRLNAAVIEHLDAYRTQDAAKAVENFVDDLNNWYIRRSRRRFWSNESNEAKESAYQTLYQVLITLARIVAPFTPFVGEELYQTLERPFTGAGAPESVHLTDYPTPKPDQVDEPLERAMSSVLRIVKLGHAARNQSQLKVRQPLAKVVAVTLDESMRPDIEPYREIVLDELNIKNLEWAANRDRYVTYQVRPNFRKLGPRFGRQMPQVKAAIMKMEAPTIKIALDNGRAVILELNGRQEQLTEEELEVTIVEKEGTSTANDEGLLVVLDTVVTPQLRQEGLAREVISRIQSLRKEMDLDYTDRVELVVDTGDNLREVIEDSMNTIKSETLAESLRFEGISEESDVYQDTIEGTPIRVRLTPIQ